MKIKVFIVLALVISAILIFTGCGAKTIEETEDIIKITGFEDGKEIAFSIDDLYGLPQFDGRVEGADSEGEPVIYDVKGAYLKDLLKENDKDINDIEGLRLVATDGYSIEIQKDIILNRDILLGYEMDGEPLDEQNAPLRIFIPEERAMYWVRMVSELVVLKEKTTAKTNEIYFLEAVSKDMDLEDFEFFDSIDKAINTQRFLDKYNEEGQDTILLTGADGLEKFETVDNFKMGVIKVSGRYAPMFTSDILPVGMYVKDMLFIKYGTKVFYSAAKGIEGNAALTLKNIVDTGGMSDVEKLTLTGRDEKLELSADELKNYHIELTKDDFVTVYDESKEVLIEDLISIKK